MKSKLLPLLILLLIMVIAGAAGYWYFSNNPEEWQQVLVDFGLEGVEVLQTDEQKEELLLTASGFIEAHEVPIASETGGRIERLAVEKGDAVTQGQPVVFLEDSVLGAQKEQIEARIALAEAQLDQLEAGTPSEAIAVAEAAIASAEAQRDAAEQAWQDAILLRDTPQQMEAQIDAASSQVQITRLQMEQAAYLRDAIDLQEDVAREYWDLYQEYPIGNDYQVSADWNLATMDLWQGYITWEGAEAAHASAVRKLDTLTQLKGEPLQAQLLVAQAEANYHAKVAAVEVAQARLEQLGAPIPEAQISVLEARRDQARTQLDTLATQAKKFTIGSPIDGVVVKKTAYQGEVAIPGIALLTVADLDELRLTVYVAASDYGRLREGQRVEVTVDSHPQEVFQGFITHISNEAEFTPKNVQTQEERVSLVYAIKITLSNESHKLKPGVPADVVFVEAESQ
ncbi:MAG: efflux RND transporter periplasmic adaptor subunit [Chloroflexota bacterium]|nr:efflux RND transporter periplasmic adaptor subunit [Chloroflexota bacterium]